MNVREVMAGARRLVTDQAAGVRQRSSDADYVDFVGQALGHVATTRPDLVAAQAVMTAADVPEPFDPRNAPRIQAGSNYHQGPADSFRIIKVIRYQPNSDRRRPAGGVDRRWYPVDQISYPPLAEQGGAPVLARVGPVVGPVADVNPLLPRERTGEEGLYTEDNRPQWAAELQSPNRFFFFPKPVAGGRLHLEYARSPLPLVAPDGGDVLDVELPLAEVYYSVMVACTAWLAETINDESVNDGRAQMLRESWMNALGQGARSREITDTETAGVEGAVQSRQGGAPDG